MFAAALKGLCPRQKFLNDRKHPQQVLWKYIGEHEPTIIDK